MNENIIYIAKRIAQGALPAGAGRGAEGRGDDVLAAPLPVL